MTHHPCPGFKTAGVSAGLKKNGRRDLGMIYSETPAAVAGLFTRNLVQAAPVQLDRERIKSGLCRALVVNSGNANCCTGEAGRLAAEGMARAAARGLGIDEQKVLVASTGVIGLPLPLDKVEAAMSGLIAELRPEGVMDLARAMMTTDTVPKVVSRRAETDSGPFFITGVAKGAGMIRPDVATMLCFLMTDVSASPEQLQRLLAAGSDRSFNRISIDGDTSTNDTVLLMASGVSRVDLKSGGARRLFEEQLNEVMLALAKGLVKDGEGATKLVEITVKGALTDRDAMRIADTVAHSNLVKTAFFGEDANWGRILAAAGRAGVPLDPQKVDLYFGDVRMVSGGVGAGAATEANATRVLKRDEFTVTLDLNMGAGHASMITCDFSVDYVKINADYRT